MAQRWFWHSAFRNTKICALRTEHVVEVDLFSKLSDRNAFKRILKVWDPMRWWYHSDKDFSYYCNNYRSCWRHWEVSKASWARRKSKFYYRHKENCRSSSKIVSTAAEKKNSFSHLNSGLLSSLQLVPANNLSQFCLEEYWNSISKSNALF